VRLGDPLRDLVRQPGGPSRGVLNGWKRLRPDFAAALALAAREAAAARYQAMRGGRARPYDQAVADQVVLRVMRGQPMRGLTRGTPLPGRTTLDRWRRAEPEFDAALRRAARPGLRARIAGSRRCTPALTAAICAHIAAGGSVSSAARAVAGAPRRGTLQVWMRTRPEFARAMARAREGRDEGLAQAALAIAQAATPASLAADARAVGALRKRWAQMSGGGDGWGALRAVRPSHPSPCPLPSHFVSGERRPSPSPCPLPPH